MARDLRLILVNCRPHFTAELRASLAVHPFLKIVAEVEEPALLAQAVRQFPADVVWVDLDPAPEAVLPLIAQAIEENQRWGPSSRQDGQRPDSTGVMGGFTGEHRPAGGTARAGGGRSAAQHVAFFASAESADAAVILKAMRTGVREFFPKPVDAHALDEALHKVLAQRVEQKQQGHILAVMGASGGVGASVLTVNLAVELSQFAGGPVALVDLDYRFGQVATLLDVDPTYTLADLCHSPEQLEPSVIQRALVRHESGVYVLSRPATFAQADTITAAACAGLLAVLQQTHEFVVTDGPVRFDPASRAVLDVADSALLVLQLLVPQVRNAVRIIEEMRANGYNTSRIKLVCNRVGRDTGQLSEKDAAETLGLAPFAVVPEDWAAVSGAVNLGEPLAQHGPKSKARLAIREIARRLHQPDDATDDRSTRNKGLIRRIFAAGAHA